MKIIFSPSKKNPKFVSKKRISAFLFCIFFALFPSEGLSMTVDPRIQWKVWKLSHFDLVFDAEQQDLARIYAQKLNKIVPRLGPYFIQLPRKTVVVLNDYTDNTNGFATTLMNFDPVIGVYPVLPSRSDTIDEYGDWIEELLTHEYTHIISLEQRRGPIPFLWYLVGNWATPNMFLPRWSLEGIAVEMETRLSQHGRLRSKLQDASLRALYLDNALDAITIGETNEVGLSTWPYGARPYLFGSLLWSDLMADYGETSAGFLLHSTGGRVPFFINDPLIDKYGTDYVQAFQKSKKNVSNRIQKQIEILTSSKAVNQILAKKEKLNFQGLEILQPAISPDGLKMVLLAKDDTNKRLLEILVRPNLEKAFGPEHKLSDLNQERDEGASSNINVPIPRNSQGAFNPSSDGPPSGVIQRVSWFPDSQQIIFDKINELNQFHETSDLYIYNLQTKKLNPLSKGLRAKDAAVSPDGKKIAYIGIRAGATDLWIMDLNSQTKTTKKLLYKSQLQERVSFPEFIENDKIIFSLRSQGVEQTHIISIDQPNKTLKIPVDGSDQVHTFKVVKNKLYFLSAKNGVLNLYQTNKNFQHFIPLSNSLTSLSSYDVDPISEDIYSSELTSKGFALYHQRKSSLSDQHSHKKDEHFQGNIELPRIHPLFADRYPAPATPARATETMPPTPSPSLESLEENIQDYSAWSYLKPTYWFPLIEYSTPNQWLLGIDLEGGDVLGKHSYSVSINYNSKLNNALGKLSYLNRTTAAQILLVGISGGAQQLRNNKGEYLVTEIQNGTIHSEWQLEGLSTNLFASIGWVFESLRYSQTLAKKTGPEMSIFYKDLSQSGAQISPERGQKITLNFQHFAPVKSDYDDEDQWGKFDRIHFSIEKYFSRWLPKHHAIKIKGSGTYTMGPVSILDYETSKETNSLYNGILNSYYTMRGYSTGQFLGSKLIGLNLEYTFPIKDYLNWSYGTWPFYGNRLYGAFLLDGLRLDGYGFKEPNYFYYRLSSEKTFWGTGFELKLDINIGYSMPLTSYLGIYQNLDDELRPQTQSIRLGIAGNF